MDIKTNFLLKCRGVCDGAVGIIDPDGEVIVMVVKAGSVFLDSKFKQCDIRITNGFVTEIGESLYPATAEAVYDAGGCYVIPGLFDIHMHGAVDEDSGSCQCG